MTTRLAYLLTALGLLLLLAASAHAASLKICWSDPSTVDAATVPAFAGATQLTADLLPGSTVVASVRCNTTPILASLPRNVDLNLTLRATNSLGEVSAPSNGVSFRLASAPPFPTGVTVSIVTTP